MTDLTQAWPTPRLPRPIVIVGAGAIVRTAHLPVYRRLGFPVAGLFDIRPSVARATADAFGVETVFASLEEACVARGAVFDLAVPADQILGILERLPARAAVLIQKPMGPDLAAAKAIRAACHARGLTAAVNLQLRFSPGVLAVRDLMTRGALGTIVDIEVRLVTSQPWHLWDFLRTAPRLEILYHSIHYLDTIRWLAGEPDGVYCRVVAHPELPEFRDTRSTIILDYGDRVRCSLVLNHTHRAGRRHRASHLKIEGTLGAALLTLGVNLDYPDGPPDTLQVSSENADWQDVPLRGSWFIEAFEGPMSNLQRFVTGDDAVLVGSVDDAIRTMALVEACYLSSAGGRTPIPEWE